MMHSNLTRWIEDADARDVFLETTTAHESQRVGEHQYIHLGHTIKKVVSWWHHYSDGRMFFCHRGPAHITRH